MTLASATPWGTWRTFGLAAWPGYGDIMRLRPATRALLLGLGGWAAATSLLAAAILLWPSSAPAPDTPLSAGPRRAEDDAAITERPLFAKTRRAASLPVFVPPAPPPRDRDIALKGVFVDRARARAFLTSGTEPQGRWLAANDTIAGWTVASLTPDEVRLTADGDTLTVPLHRSGLGAMAAHPGVALVPQTVPSPMPPGGQPSGSGIEPGLVADVKDMNGARAAGPLGIGAKPLAKAP